MVGCHERVREILEPVRVGVRVVINIGDDFTSSGFPARVPRAAQAVIFSSDESKWVLGGDVSRVVARSIINHDDFIVGVFQPQQTFKTLADHSPAVITAQHDRDGRPLLFRWEGTLDKRTANCRQGGFRTPFAVGHAESPVCDIMTSAIPLVGPAEYESSGTPFRERSPNLPIQKMGLFFVAVPDTVQSDLCQQERPIAGNILKPRYVCGKRLLAL